MKEGSSVALVGYRTMVQNCFEASMILEDLGVSTTLVDARFCKRLDQSLIRELALLNNMKFSSLLKRELLEDSVLMFPISLT